MRIYFDLCGLQRSFDDQSQLRTRLEADAINSALTLFEAGLIILISSFALRIENGRNPHPDRRAFVAGLLARATEHIERTSRIEHDARGLLDRGLKTMDALHLACAVAVDADYFCTCDDRFLKRARTIDTGATKVVSPLELLTELDL